MPAVAARAPCLFLLAFRVLAVETRFIEKRLRIDRAGGRLAAGRNPARCAQNHQFSSALLNGLALEKIAQNRNIPEPWNLAGDVGDPVVQQARDHEALAVLQFEFCIRFPCTNRWNSCPRDRYSVGEVQGTHLRHDPQMNVSIGLNHRSELETNTKLAELNCHRRKSLAARLRHRKGEFAAREEAGLLASHGNQIG